MLDPKEMCTHESVALADLFKQPMFKNSTVEDVISSDYVVDYRNAVYCNLMYLESPEYLLSLTTVEEVLRLNPRQRYIMLNHILCYRRIRDEKRTALYAALSCDLDQFDYWLTDLFSDGVPYSDRYAVSFDVSDRPFVRPSYKKPLIPIRDLCDLFHQHLWLPTRITEAKAVCIGLGLSSNVQWNNIADYHLFATEFVRKYDTVKLMDYKMDYFYKYGCDVKQYVNPCVVCCDAEISTVFACGHAAMCRVCANKRATMQQSECVVCRKSSYVSFLYI